MDDTSKKLVRGLGLVGIIALGVDNVIGGGINYVSVQIQGKVVGIGPHLPLVMLIDGLVALFIAITYSYLGSAMPRAGGEYVWVSRGWKGAMGFLSSFSFWLAQAAAAGAIAYFDPNFFGTFFNQIGLTGLGHWINSPTGTIIIGLGIIWFVWLIHIISIKSVGWTSVILMVLMFLGGFFIIYYGLANTPADYAKALQAHGIDMNHYVALGKAKAPVASLSDLPKALFIMFFAFVGFTSMSQASGETKNPKRTLAIAFPLAVVIITVYFILYAVGVYHTVPWQYILGQLLSGHSSMINGPALMGYVMPEAIAAFVTLMVAFALFNDLPPIYQTLTRLFYSWGVDEILPKWMGNINDRGVPAVSVTVNTLIVTLFFLLTVWFGWATEISVVSAAALFMYVSVGITSLTFIDHAPHLEKESALKHNILVIFAALIAIFVPSWLFIEGITTSLNQKWYLQSIVQWVIVMAIGGFVYYIAYKKAQNKGKSLEDTMKELPHS